MKCAACFILALSATAVAQTAASAPVREVAPVTDQMLAKPDPASWLMWRRTLDSWGYSPLNQINRSNVASLRLVWTRGIGEGIQRGHR